MNNEILNQFFNIQSSTIDDVKVLLKDIKNNTNNELTKKILELEKQLKKIQKAKRYGLVFEDKPEEFEEKAKNALPLLKEEKGLEIKGVAIKPTNIIIEGDNYHSLSCLKYTHQNKIDVIYIDPPYNTGNNDFIYNDKRINDRYDDGSYVGKDDPFRHSKWLSFMKKRLILAKDLLKDDGVIFISIDDNEQAQLKMLCDEIFDENNFIAKLIWNQKTTGGHDSTHINIIHEYIYMYGKNKFLLNINKDISNTEYNLFDKIENKFFKWDSLWTVSHGYTKNCDYGIIGENGFEIFPWMCHKNKNKVKGIARWYWSKETYEKNKENLLIKQDKNGDFKVYKKVFSSGEKPFQSILQKEQVLGTSAGKQILENIFGSINIFSNPKSLELLKYILKISSQKNSIILDFFAGSGTTGHAVLELNKEDSGNRQFILCSNKEATKENPEKNICKNITYERNKRVIQGYTNAKGEQVEGLGGNLKYYTTDFIKIEKSIDDLRYKFINMCDDLLCIKENTFEIVKLKTPNSPHYQGGSGKLGDFLKLYRNNSNYTVILYDIFHFQDLLKLVQTLDGKIKIYIFSISKEIYEEELSYLEKNIEIANIPDDILETYKKIFNF